MTQGGLAILALAIYVRGGDKAVDPRGEVTRRRIQRSKGLRRERPLILPTVGEKRERDGYARIWWQGSARRKGIDGKAVRGGKRRCEIQL